MERLRFKKNTATKFRIRQEELHNTFLNYGHSTATIWGERRKVFFSCSSDKTLWTSSLSRVFRRLKMHIYTIQMQYIIQQSISFGFLVHKTNYIFCFHCIKQNILIVYFVLVREQVYLISF